MAGPGKAIVRRSRSIDCPGVGAMEVHYVKGGLVGSPTVDAATPEALV